MSFVDRVKETARDAMSGGKRQAKRAQLEMKNRQVERAITKEYARIGRTLYPLLSGGQISTNNAEVETAVKAIADLRTDVEQRREEIERVLRPEDSGPTEHSAPDSVAEAESKAES